MKREGKGKEDEKREEGKIPLNYSTRWPHESLHASCLQNHGKRMIFGVKDVRNLFFPPSEIFNRSYEKQEKRKDSFVPHELIVHMN